MRLPKTHMLQTLDAMRLAGIFSIRILCPLCILFLAIGLCLTPPAHSADKARRGLAHAAPETVGLRGARLKQIDRVVMESIEAREIPGAVVLVARHGKVAYLKAFGSRAILPKPEIMTVDTIFDIASLTKVTATLPCVMLLAENGSVRIEDRVKRYLPNFSGGGKDAITVRHLLTHYSGLAPDFDLSKNWSGRAAALEELWNEKTQLEPGKECVYSDLNFIALGEIVRAVSGKPLDVLAQELIFGPLGMRETFFHPPANLVPRIAPTEPRKNTLQYLKGKPAELSDAMVRGEVHDPTAWRMGGVAGHAGLFSSAQDLAIYAQMILGGGAYEGTRVLSRMAVDAMTRPQSPPGMQHVRGFGWDLDSRYSAPRGDLFRGGFGHSGFTGTSLWIHPQSDSFVIVLSNRVHPEGGKDINHLRGAIANIVAAAVTD